VKRLVESTSISISSRRWIISFATNTGNTPPSLFFFVVIPLTILFIDDVDLMLVPPEGRTTNLTLLANESNEFIQLSVPFTKPPAFFFSPLLLPKPGVTQLLPLDIPLVLPPPDFCDGVVDPGTYTNLHPDRFAKKL
jgi:hypothetical protein